MKLRFLYCWCCLLGAEEPTVCNFLKRQPVRRNGDCLGPNEKENVVSLFSLKHSVYSRAGSSGSNH
jgi:hypothetical protein